MRYGRLVPSVEHPELTSVGPHEVVVTFTGPVGSPVTTRVGDQEITTVGPHHVATIGGLEPATRYELEVEGAAHDTYLPASIMTLERPAGRLLATIATANDVHFGETECGNLHGVPEDDIHRVIRSEPGEPPYPEVMNGAVIDAMGAFDPTAVLVKGDLTDVGSVEQYESFLGAYGVLGQRMRHVRGNHDAMIDPTMVATGAPFAIDLPGVTLAVLDTVIPGSDRGQLDVEQIHFLDELAAQRTGPVLVFGHHHPWNVDSQTRDEAYFGINPDDSDRLVDLYERHENLVGYFAGHTHRNRVRRFARSRDVPFVEVGCTKDYPGAWGEYRIYEGGYTQIVRRAVTPAALDWADKTRLMFWGLYRDYALGSLEDRCFAQRW